MVSQPSPVQENAAAVFWASLYSDNVGTPSSICSLAGAKPLSTAGGTSVWVYFSVAYFVGAQQPQPRLQGIGTALRRGKHQKRRVPCQRQQQSHEGGQRRKP